LGYESIRKSLHPINGARPLSASEDFASAFLAGSVSGAFAAAITTPFDVAKTRQQINSSAACTLFFIFKKKFFLKKKINNNFVPPNFLKKTISRICGHVDAQHLYRERMARAFPWIWASHRSNSASMCNHDKLLRNG